MTKLPPLEIKAVLLSTEHHLLRRLNDEEPSSLHEVLGRILKLYPNFTRLGLRADQPTPAALLAWQRLSRERWTRSSTANGRTGLVLTGLGELRLIHLYELEVRTPYLRSIERMHGRAAADSAALLYPRDPALGEVNRVP